MTRPPARQKYPAADLIASSEGRGWIGLSAQIRHHDKSIIAWHTPQLETEVCISIHDSRSIVTRRSADINDRTVARRGVTWLSPAGSTESVIDISDPVQELLHMNLPLSQFSPENVGLDADGSLAASLRYEGGFRDPLLTEIGYAVASELRAETLGGQMLIETLANTMVARLVQNHFGREYEATIVESPTGGLDKKRLSRVLEYIDDNLEADLSIRQLAAIACLSQFHFTRAFKMAVGLPPHRYISEKRLEHAKYLLKQREVPLVDIALALQFSSQANFTRAFRRLTGYTPGQFRCKA